MPKSPVVLTYIGGLTVLIELGPFRLLTDRLRWMVPGQPVPIA